MPDWNVIVGMPALAMGALVMWAFRRYALTWRGSATQHLGAALFWLAARAVCRSVWWDFFVGFGLGNSSNWIWNLMAIYATYHALKGFYLLIPAAERAEYNLLTVAFYPRRLSLRRQNEDDT